MTWMLYLQKAWTFIKSVKQILSYFKSKSVAYSGADLAELLNVLYTNEELRGICKDIKVKPSRSKAQTAANIAKSGLIELKISKSIDYAGGI
jgi:hypothetical protein